MNTFVNQITLRNFSLLFLPFFFCLFSNAKEKETEEKGGAVIGRKWVNEKRYTFEIHAGIGRYFVFESNGNAYHQDTAYPRINFAIGRRFYIFCNQCLILSFSSSRSGRLAIAMRSCCIESLSRRVTVLSSID